MTEQQIDQQAADQQLSLGTAAARNLATTTKSVPQMQGISTRWLLKLLPWVRAAGGAYRVNRRVSYTVGDGRITFMNGGADLQVVPRELGELAPLRGFDDEPVLEALSGRFVREEYAAGDVIVEAGGPVDRVVLIAHGKAGKIGTGEYGDEATLGVVADGGFFGDRALVGDETTWEFSVKALTACTVLILTREQFHQVLALSDDLRTHVEDFERGPGRSLNPSGEAAIELASGHTGEPVLPGTFVDYELKPREYELSVAQTVLRVHSRVADLYNEPMDQVEQQLRLTIEALRERQENELVNNRDFGLLHNVEPAQRIPTRSGPPTPDDLDELITLVWKDPAFFLANPKTIAAFGRECSKRGIYPDSVDVNGHRVPGWRGIPIFPCNKIPISRTSTSPVLLMRTGEAAQGVIGLHQTGLPDEVQPGLSVRFMGVDEKAIISYLVSAYYSAAVLVPDALAVLENAEIAHGGAGAPA
ncbi:family 2B encapsulin nanocompartment shell protein [Actinomadura rugatobispora]|uniref:Family 2B encapsulin nanocompartment shell protein n=1 Tax=Actinomadura rugatobispora TaxID=1994 RepID=A0ABW0ZPJ2_9ACTN|nr:family 2B encapsulin nanocompartment shell protein [Actinomadura rugatobispora]